VEIGVKGLEIGVEEGERCPSMEQNGREEMLQLGVEVTVDKSADGKFHVGGFEMEVFHDAEGMVEGLVVVLGREAVGEEQSAVVEGLDVGGLWADVQQDGWVAGCGGVHHGINQDGVLAHDIDSGHGYFEGQDGAVGSSEDEVGVERGRESAEDALFWVGLTNRVEVLAVETGVVEMGGNPHRLHGGDNESHLPVVQRVAIYAFGCQHKLDKLVGRKLTGGLDVADSEKQTAVGEYRKRKSIWPKTNG